MSQSELARLLRKHRNTVGSWMRGEVLPDRARVADIVGALKCTDAEKAVMLEVHAGLRIAPSSHNVPYSWRTPYFTGREEVLEELRHRLDLRRHDARPQALTGLGGMGKTQSALQYAHRHRSDYRYVLWAVADSRDTLVSELGKLAASLGLPEQHEKDPYEVVSAVRNWLGEHPDWLLILDNVEDLSLVAWVIPSEPLGAVLLTTRLQTTEPVARAYALEAMSIWEGAFLLLWRAHQLAPDAPFNTESPDEYPEARAISHAVGGLPLALDQAGAYILETRSALADYLPLYEQRHADLLARRGTVPTDHPSVAATFSLYFERIQQESQAAADLLHLCAFLAPGAIPEILITEGEAHLGPVLAPVAADAYAFNEIVEVLGSLSLLQRDPNRKEFSLHRVVQTVLRDQMSEAVRKEWITRCILLLDKAFPPLGFPPFSREESDAISGEQIERCLRLHQHVLDIFAITAGWQTPPLAAASLFQKMADYLWPDFDAESLYLRALQIREQALGPDHLDVGATLHALADFYAMRNSTRSRSTSLYQRVVQIREQELGPDHPDVATALENLAEVHGWQGQHAQAEPLYRRALQIRIRALGPDHPDLAAAVQELMWGPHVRQSLAQRRAILHRSLLETLDALDQAMWQLSGGPM